MNASLLQGFWHELGVQLRHPSGSKGRWVGRFMSVVNREPNRLAIAALKVSQTDNILELGVGSGWALRQLVQSGNCGLISGVDQSAEMLRFASRSFRSAGAKVVLAQARFDSLPFGDGTFDKLLAVNTAYFFHADGRDLREAHRVMRVGGRLAIYVSDRTTLAKWPFAGADTHRSYDAEDLTHALRCGGFSADDIRVDIVRLPLGVCGLLATAHKS